MPEAQVAAPAASPSPAAPAAIPGTPGVANPAEAAAAKAPMPPEFIEVMGEKIPYKQFEHERKIAKTYKELEKASHDRFRQAADQSKKLQQWATSFEADPFEATIQYFESKGAHRAQAEQLARQKFENAYKTRYIEPETMTPEQREAAKWKAEAEAARKEKEEWAKQKQTEEEQVHTQAVRQAMQKEIIDTLETSGLPKTRFIASRINFFMQQNIKNGYEAPREMIIQQVKDEGKSIVGAYVAGLPADQFAEWLGPEGLKKFRQYEVAEYKKRQSGSGGGGQTQQMPRRGEPQTGRKTMSDVDNYFNELRRAKK